MTGRRKRKVKNLKKDCINKLMTGAISKGSLKSVKNLVKLHGLSCCEEWHDGYKLLCDAIKAGHTDIAKFLLEKGSKVDRKTNCTDIPLHLATKKRCIELVGLLLKRNAAVNMQNCHGETALHLACWEGYPDIVEALLSNKANMTLRTKEGTTPLFMAAECRHELVVCMLLRHACTNLRTSARTKNSTLLDRVLLCDPFVRDKVNKLVGSIVTQDDGQSKIVDELINYGFIFSRKFVNKSLLLAAVKKNYVKLIDNILKNCANWKDAKHNALFLHAAVEKGHKEIVELFLNSGFDANAKNEVDKTPIYYSLSCKEEDKCVEIIMLLLAGGADMWEAPELLHTAVNEGLIKVCHFLIDNGIDVNAVNTRGETPLYLSCDWALSKESRQKKDSIATLLLGNGADVNIQAANGRTAFHRAALNGRKNVVSLFLECGVNVNLRAKDDWTPLHFASEYGGEEITEVLLRNKANVDARQKDGWTPLHRAACSKYPSSTVIEMLLKFGADIDARGYENKTALHCVFSAGFYSWRNDVVRSFLDNGCDINAETSDGKTAFDLAISRSESAGFDVSSLEPSVETLTKYAIKLKAAGLYVSAKNSYVLNHLVAVLHLTDSVFAKLSNFWQECEEEVNRMKSKRLNPQFTLYDLLLNSQNPSFARNKYLIQKFKSFNLDKFPMYKSVILGNLRRSKSRLELLNSGRRTLDMLVKTSSKLNGLKYSVLPIEIVEHIVSYLNTSELNNLLSCGETLKCQLKCHDR